MKITREDMQGVVILRLEGSLVGDPKVAAVIETAVDGAIRDGKPHVILDLGEVGWVNSGGLEPLIVSWTRLQRCQGSMKLSRTAKRFQNVLMATRLNQILESYRDVEEALASYPEAYAVQGERGRWFLAQV